MMPKSYGTDLYFVGLRWRGKILEGRRIMSIKHATIRIAAALVGAAPALLLAQPPGSDQAHDVVLPPERKTPAEQKVEAYKDP